MTLWPERNAVLESITDFAFLLEGLPDLRVLDRVVRGRCPFPDHDDCKPSFVLYRDTGRWACSCGGGDSIDLLLHLHGWSFLESLAWLRDRCGSAPKDLSKPQQAARAQRSLTASEACEVWKSARQRASERLSEDSEAFGYLETRGLIGALPDREGREGVAGIVHESMSLPPAIAWWPRAGYRVVAPLYDLAGEVVSLQSRLVIDPGDDRPRFRSPPGAPKGTVFASNSGVEVLKPGCGASAPIAILAEGMTDTLALGVSIEVPVIGCPGKGTAMHAVGPWVHGRDVYLALDGDVQSGELEDVARAINGQGGTCRGRIIWSAGFNDAADVLARLGRKGLGQGVYSVLFPGGGERHVA